MRSDSGFRQAPGSGVTRTRVVAEDPGVRVQDPQIMEMRNGIWQPSVRHEALFTGAREARRRIPSQQATNVRRVEAATGHPVGHYPPPREQVTESA